MKHVAEFKKMFSGIARHHRRSDVFRDFVMMSGLSVANAYYKSEQLESEYMQIVKRYGKDDAQGMAVLLGIVVDALHHPQDFLGRIYMELELANDALQQFFTPPCINELLGRLNIEGVKDIVSKQGFITCSEPAVGSGGMIIGLAKEMLDAGLNPQQQLWFEATDIDPLAAMMTLLQTNLLGLSGRVIVGNTLTQKHQRIYHTLFHVMNDWDGRLKARQQAEALKAFFSCERSVEQVVKQPTHANRRPTVVSNINLYDALF